jgi:diguanylate cyclase (GGDEF)-like protein
MPKVLLVEDDEMNRDMLSRRLARRGFDVVVALDGRQGVEMAEKELPDIILMDMSLPVLDGWGATRLLKAGQATRSIPVIALTAHALADDRSRALEAGCDDYDTKPVELPRLLDKMDRLLVGKPNASTKEPLTPEALALARHELKTCFNQILGYTEMLLDEVERKGLQTIAPDLGELHSSGRSLLEAIQTALADQKNVGSARLEVLEPEVNRLFETSGSLTGKLRRLGKQDALPDIERISSALLRLRSLIRKMRGEPGSEPVETAPRVEALEPDATLMPTPNGAGRLLIVEDDVGNRDLLQQRLARQGYSVEVAQDGPTALEKISREQYDLVLLDQMMPGMSGLDLLRLLRATHSASELPVIMVTAVDQSQTIVEALDRGANDYVAKPMDMPVVMARIHAQLARSKADRHTKLLDPLTGLSNRLLLSARLADAIARQPRSGTAGLAVLLLDLDGFKVVNDSFGHGAGDKLLIEIAQKLKSAIAECNLTSKATIARIGGDEFVILIEPLDHPDQPKTVGEAILACLAKPTLLHGLRFTITASIGIALGATEDAAPEQLLRDADLAMYRAKELGKNRLEMYDPSLHERAQSRMATAIDLRHAIERAELLAVYQPLVQLRTKAIVGFEALLRWRHPTRGLLSPSEFISVAEETGMIIPIGEWILGQACRQLKAWQEQFPSFPPLEMNVNLSIKQLKDPNLLNHIRRSLSETGIPPETLRLELTESSLMTEIESAKEVLASIQALHVGLKLDDFGTGYSSLSYLRTLHFDSLKIDRSFVERLASDRDSRAIVETILNLAGLMSMTAIAEGVETEHQLDELISLGCETGQGFYFSKPLEAEAAGRLLESTFRTNSPAENGAWAEPLSAGIREELH